MCIGESFWAVSRNDNDRRKNATYGRMAQAKDYLMSVSQQNERLPSVDDHALCTHEVGMTGVIWVVVGNGGGGTESRRTGGLEVGQADAAIGRVFETGREVPVCVLQRRIVSKPLTIARKEMCSPWRNHPEPG
jgi:hypothetical protein